MICRYPWSELPLSAYLRVELPASLPTCPPATPALTSSSSTPGDKAASLTRRQPQFIIINHFITRLRQNRQPPLQLNFLLPSNASCLAKDNIRFPQSDFSTTNIMAMFSQNPVMNGPNYSFADVPKDTVDGLREHRFNP